MHNKDHCMYLCYAVICSFRLPYPAANYVLSVTAKERKLHGHPTQLSFMPTYESTNPSQWFTRDFLPCEPIALPWFLWYETLQEFRNVWACCPTLAEIHHPRRSLSPSQVLHLQRLYYYDIEGDQSSNNKYINSQ